MLVLVTNPQPHCQRLAALLESRGCQVISLPLWAIVTPSDGGESLRSALRQLRQFQWVAFTSQFAVDAVVRYLGDEDIVWPKGKTRVAAVGSATAEALRTADIPVDCLTMTANATALANAMGEAGMNGVRVLVPQARHGRMELAEGLAHHGANVELVEAYAARPAPVDAATWLRQYADQPIDAVTFTAPSAAARFAELFGGPPTIAPFTTTRWYAIGTTTSAAMERHGLIPAVVAKEPSFRAIADAVVAPIK